MGYGNCGGERTLNPNGTEAHCCYLQGEVCPLLVDWEGTIACGLMLMSDGDWDAVEADPRYIAWIKPRLDQMAGDVSCRTWPSGGTVCGDCGASNSDAIGTVPVALRPNEKNRLQKDVLLPQLEQWAIDHPDEGG